MIYYNDARLSLLSSVFESIDVLSKNINGSIQPANGDMIVERILSNVSSFTEDEVYLKRPLGEDVVNKEQKGKSLRAVFDGMNRVGCEFTISDSNGTYQTNSDSVEEWSANNLLMPSRNDDQNNFSTDSLDVNGKTLNLVKFWRISQANSVYLSDKVVIPREEDDELARAVRESQLALKELDAVLQDNLHSIYSRDLCRSSGKMIERRDKWSKLEDIYVTQQVKKALCLSIEQGMKETSMHHNSWAQQVVPASWMLPVAGRPNDENEKDDDLPEDAICMCCFDGVSTDENKILFCDGCNCVIHQVCYGIKGVPEGDFFCDRCQYICLLCDELDDAIYSVDLRSAVMCCLCPVQHGALKPTTDSRWVHLCCAYWSENAVVKSLNSMGPVDITEVEVQSTDMASFGDNSPALCCFCNIPGGFVVNCTHSSNEANSEKCSAVFHPICAWFTGMYFNVNLSDRSFLSNSTGGNISEEMTFEYCCVLHSLERYGSSETLVEHKNYRQKYCMKPSDLDNIPGSRRKRKTHKKKEKPQSVSRKTSTTTSTQNKELNIDLYDTKYCAACYKPTSTDALMLGEEHDRITALANLPLYEELDVSRIVQECADSVSMAIPHELQAILSDKGKIDISSPLTDNEAPPQTNNDAPMKKEIITSLPLVDPISKVSAINQNGSTASVTSVNDKQSDALAMNGKQKQEKTSSTESIPSILSCKKCTLTIHRDCYIGSVEFPDKSNYSSWLCDNCKLITVPSESTTTQPPTCVLCPRRGGYVRITNEASTAHVYCAKACPGNTSVSTDGIIEMKSIAKEFKKQKCCICNRKSGVCIRCSTLGCDSYFHPICGIRSGKGYVHTRMGESVNFCSAHIPEGIVRLSSGHWIDGYEVQRLRYSLDRARIIFDVMLKREKLKRSWYKSQTEDFDSRFRRRLDQATGNKHNKDNDSVSHESTDESDNETLSEAGDDVVDENAFVELSRIPITSETSVYTIHDEDVEISGRWTNQAKDIVLPSSIVVALAGIEVKKKDTLLDGGLPRFLKETSSKIVKETDRIREYTGCFVSQRAADEFGRNLPGVVSSLVALPNDLFVKEMESFHVKAKLLMEKVKKSGGKKGYVLVEESPAPVEVQEVVEVVGGRRSRSVKSLSEDAVIIDGVEANDLALPSRENFLGRKRRRSAETEVTQPVPVIEAKESEKRKRSLSIKDLEEDTLPKKRRTSTTIDANPAATNLSEQLISPKRLKANKVKDISTPSNIEIENKMNKNSKFVKNGSTKRITDHFQPVTITPGQDLCKLERRLLDILNGLYAESPSFGIDNFTGQFASPRRLTTPSRENNTSMELTSTGNRRSRRLVLPGDTNQSNSGDHDEEMLLKDYMSVPEEISNAMEPQLILTLDTIKDALMNHLYPTIHSFTKDMNDMLNSNRVVYQSKKEVNYIINIRTLHSSFVFQYFSAIRF